MDFPIYCINLQRREKRLQFAISQLSKLKRQFHVIPALDAQSVEFSSILARHKLKFHNLLSNAEKAEFCSHYTIWEKIASSHEDIALVVEDDACFVDNTADILNSLNFQDLLHFPALALIGYVDPFTASLKPVGGKVEFNKSKLPGSCHAYFITREGAIKILSLCANKDCIKYPVNLQIFTFIDELKLLQINHCLSHQNFSLEGDIQTNNAKNAILEIYRRCGFPF